MYDYAPNIYGYNETEEERRRREQQEQQAQQFGAPIEPIAPLAIETAEPDPIKQTITYDPATGEQRMKIEGSVEDLSPDNAMTPTVSMPGAVSPEQMAQQQQPMQAPVAQPGPGQQPQQLPPGVQMVNGRLQLAPTTPVEPMTPAQAEMPAQEPTPMTPAQAEMPAGEPMPQLPQPGPAVQVAGPAQMPPAAQPAPVAQQPTDPIEAFTSAVGDTSRLLQIYNDKASDPELRRMAGREASRQLDSETRRADAEKRVSTMSPTEIAREMRGSSEEGSWTKRVIFGLLNMQGAMAAEDAKLGIGAKYQSTVLNGQPVMVKVRADGKPMEGFNAQTRQPLEQRDLVAAVANMTAIKGANIGGQVYRDPVTNQTLTKVDTQQGPIYYDKAGNRTVPKGEPVPLTAGSDIATQLQIAQMRRQQQFVNMTAEARLRAFAETNAERALADMPPLTPAQMGLNANGELIGQPQPQVPPLQQPPGMAGGAAPAAPGAAPAAPGAAPTTQRPPAATAPSDMAPVPAAGQAGGDLRAQRQLREIMLKDAADVLKGQAAIVGDLLSTERSVKVLQDEKTNFGTILQGQLPGEKALGRMFRTEDNIRTENVLDAVNKQAAINVKMLGVNPTDRDLQFVVSTKPNETWPPEAVADWLRKSASASRRALDFAREQVKSGGRFIADSPQEQPRTPRSTTQPTVSNW